MFVEYRYTKMCVDGVTERGLLDEMREVGD